MRDENIILVREALEQKRYHDACGILCSLVKHIPVDDEMEELANQAINMPSIADVLPESGFPNDPGELKNYMYDHHSLGWKLLYKLPELCVLDQGIFPKFPYIGEWYSVKFIMDKEKLFRFPSFGDTYDWYTPEFNYSEGVLHVSQGSKFRGDGKSIEDIHRAIYRIRGHLFYEKYVRYHTSA
jgi:hypothetical protein